MTTAGTHSCPLSRSARVVSSPQLWMLQSIYGTQSQGSCVLHTEPSTVWYASFSYVIGLCSILAISFRPEACSRLLGANSEYVRGWGGFDRVPGPLALELSHCLLNFFLKQISIGTRASSSKF